MAKEERDKFAVVAHVMLWQNDRLFLLRRHQTGFMDGYFALPGGHQAAGESVVDCAKRECLEETGVIVQALEPVCVLPYRSGNTHQGLNFVFASNQWQGEPHCAEPELADQFIWSASAGFPVPLTPWIEDVLILQADGKWFKEFAWD